MAASTRSHLPTAIIADVVLVAAFTVIGHLTHGGAMETGAFVQTAWPFLAGLAAAWVLTAAWRAPLAPLATGAGVWGVTILVGLMIRAGIGEGTAGAFILVAGLLNFATLVGWRVLATAVAGRGKR